MSNVLCLISYLFYNGRKLNLRQVFGSYQFAYLINARRGFYVFEICTVGSGNVIKKSDVGSENAGTHHVFHAGTGLFEYFLNAFQNVECLGVGIRCGYFFAVHDGYRARYFNDVAQAYSPAIAHFVFPGRAGQNILSWHVCDGYHQNPDWQGFINGFGLKNILLLY